MNSLNKKISYARKEGYAFRNILLCDKVGNIKRIGEEKKEEIIRGTVYQFSNTLKVHNVELFMDLIIRLYTCLLYTSRCVEETVIGAPKHWQQGT